MRALWSILAVGRAAQGRLALAAGLSAATAATAVALTATSAWLIARAAERPPVLALLVAVTAVRAFGIGRGVLRYLERLTGHEAALRLLERLRIHVYEALERVAPSGFGDLRRGDLLARFVGDVDRLADLWLRVLLPTVGALLAAAGAVLLLGHLLAPAGAVLALAVLASATLAPAAALLVSRGSEARRAPARGRLAGLVLDFFRGAPELAALGAGDRALQVLERADADLRRAEAASAMGAGVGGTVTRLAMGLGLWFVVLLGVASVGDGRLAVVALAVLALTPLAVQEVLAVILPAAHELPGLVASAGRVEAVLGRPVPVPPPQNPRPAPRPPLGLEVRGLSLRPAADGPRLLGGLDLRVRPGQWVLVRGPSGSGKSSLAAALARFLVPAEGVIEVVGSDGTVPLAELAEEDVRRMIVVGLQDPHVFDTSLEENLRFVRPTVSRAVLDEVLAAAQLGDWVAALPDGLATLVGEHGTRLSGGQRQRLEVARALLSPAPILVLDEPTEHLDPETGRRLLASLRAHAAGRTVIVCSHRSDLVDEIPWDQVVDLPLPAASGVAPPSGAG
jgi:thiol reductant ABC exporter CydC subunit